MSHFSHFNLKLIIKRINLYNKLTKNNDQIKKKLNFYDFSLLKPIIRLLFTIARYN